MKSRVDVPFHNKRKAPVAHVVVVAVVVGGGGGGERKERKKLIPKIFREFDLSVERRNSDIRPEVL